MSTMSASICPFCCKSNNGMSQQSDYGEGVKEDGKGLLNNFGRALQWYFGGATVKVNLVDVVKMSEEKVESCQDCLALIGTVCKFYHEIKCMELQLEWKIQSLGNIAKQAERIKSRKKLLKVTIKGPEVGELGKDEQNLVSPSGADGKELYKRVRTFRKDFIKKCSNHYAKSFPRVVIERSRTSVNAEVSGTETNDGLRIGNESTIVATKCPSASQRDIFVKTFIGWSLSFSVIVILSLLSFKTSSESHCHCKRQLNSVKPISRRKKRKSTDTIQLLVNKKVVELDGVAKGRNSKLVGSIAIAGFASAHNKTEGDRDQEPDSFITANHLPKLEKVTIQSVDLSRISDKGSDTDGDIQDDNISLMSCDPEEVDEFRNNVEGAAIVNEHLHSLPASSEAEMIANVTLLERKLEAKISANSKDVVDQKKTENSQTSANNNKAVCVNNESSTNQESRDRIIGRYNLRAVRMVKKLNDDEEECGMNGSDDEYLNDNGNSSGGTSDEESDHSGLVNTTDLQCEFCDKTFKSESWLQAHLQKNCAKSNSNAAQLRLTKRKGVVKRSKVSSFRKSGNKNDPISSIAKSEYFCADAACNEKFDSEEDYEFHMKLHGDFSCNFCDTVEKFAPDLCLHEEMHSERKQKEEGCYYCPRCPYQVIIKDAYITHHLEKHMDIKKSLECPICKVCIKGTGGERHFKTCHDLRGVDPSDVSKCDEEGCSAYFVKRHQLLTHLLGIHQRDYTKLPDFNTDKEETEQSSTNCDNTDAEIQDLFECKLCGKKFRMLSWLSRHEIMAHKNRNVTIKKQKSRIRCPVAGCHERFKTKAVLEKHGKFHGKFKCKFCDIEKEYAPDIAIHEMGHSIGNPNEIIGTTKSTTAAEHCSTAESNKYHCPRCKYMSTTKGHYVTHFVEKHLKLSMKLETCGICGATCSPRNELRHFQTHHNTEGVDPKDIHKCDQCSAYFLQGIQLINHKNKMHVTVFECVSCGLTYRTRRSLQNHLRNCSTYQNLDNSHLPEVCDVPNCGKRFATKPELEWHSTFNHIYHEKVSGHVSCKICSKMCLGQNGLRVHMHQHQGPRKPKKTYFCDQCGKEFKHKVKLEIHAFYHMDPSTWPFKCPTCPKTCINQVKLDEHMRVHTKEKPFVCDTCGEKYAHRHNLRLHVKNKHGLEIPRLAPFGGGGYKGGLKKN